MRTKLIVIDLDGTLLNANDEINEQDRKILLRVQERGISVAIATGRTYAGAKQYIEAVRAYPYFLGMNGCKTVNLKTNQVLHEEFIGKEITEIVIKCLENVPVFFEVYTDDGIYALKDRKDFMYASGLHHSYIEKMINEIKFVDDIKIYNNKIYKFFVPMESEEMGGRIESGLRSCECVTVVKSLGNFIEIIPRGCDKSVGLKIVCEQMGIDLNEVFAIGDSANDKEMLTCSGIGVAMGNAKEEVKGIADYITLGNDEGGIAYAIGNFLV